MKPEPSPRVKIAVVYHRPSTVVSDDVYEPVLAGAAVMTERSKDGKTPMDPGFLAQMAFRDDDGENVSDRNRVINEMSVVYWMWKNLVRMGDPDYVGLAHYRRFFIFDESTPLPEVRWFPKSETYLYADESRFRRAIDSSACVELLRKHDVLCSFRYAASNLVRGDRYSRCRDRFVDMLGPDKGFLYDEMERLVLAARPDFAAEIEYMRLHTDHYVCNMFVMPRETFSEYCEFVFPILFRIAELNGEDRDPQTARAPGFISEFLTSIYLAHLKRTGKLRMKEMRIACWGIKPTGRVRRIVARLLPDALRRGLKRLLRLK